MWGLNWNIALLCVIISPNILSSLFDTFSDVTLNTNIATVKTPLTIEISFFVKRNITNDEVFLIRLPRFYGVSSMSLDLSPSSLYEAKWVRYFLL